MLKKEFSQSTVNRMRNLLTKKFGDRTKIQTGYEKLVEERNEGDVWEENGKKWTLKNGIKQSITKHDSIKKLVVLPLHCPNCHEPMKLTDLNKKMYSIHGECLDCVAKRETKMKIEGTFDDYKKSVIKSNRDSFYEDFERALEQWKNETNTVVTEAGEIEDWTKVNKKEMYEKIKSEIDKMKQLNS